MDYKAIIGFINASFREYSHVKARPKIYAIIETGGKQYKVTEGQNIDVERLDVAEGDSVEIDKVLAVGEGDNVTFGRPVVEGAKVVATATENGRGKKIIVFKFKAKVRYRRKNGHRQNYTRLSIDSIVAPGADNAKPVKKTTRRTKKEETPTDGA